MANFRLNVSCGHILIRIGFENKSQKNEIRFQMVGKSFKIYHINNRF